MLRGAMDKGVYGSRLLTDDKMKLRSTHLLCMCYEHFIISPVFGCSLSLRCGSL